MRKAFRIFLIILFWAAVALFGISRTKKEKADKSFEETHKLMEPIAPADTALDAVTGGDEAPVPDSAGGAADTLRSKAGGQGGDGGGA